MKSILIIHHCDAWGGAGISLIDICRMLQKEFEVSVFLPHKQTKLADKISSLGVRIYFADTDVGMISAYNGGPAFFTRTFWKNMLRIRQSWRDIARILETKKIDLIIGNSVTLSWVGKLAARYKVPYVCYVRETKPVQFGFCISEFLINRYCAGVLFISQYDREKMGFRVKKQIVVPDTLENSWFNCREQENIRNSLLPDLNKIYFLYVGGDEKIKGYDILLKAIQKIRSEIIGFLILGDVQPERQIRDDRVSYFGMVNNPEPFFEACDVLLFPSIKAHQARPVFEAGAKKKPVIISDFPETSGEVQTGYNGLCFIPGDSGDLADKIIMLTMQPDVRKKLGENNRKNTEEKHSFEACKNGLVQFCYFCIQSY